MMGDDFRIQTLDEILAGMGQSVLAKSSDNSKKTSKSSIKISTKNSQPQAKTSPKTPKTSKTSKPAKPACSAMANADLDISCPQTSSSAQPKQSKPLNLENIQNPTLAQILKDTPHESLTINDRQTNYLRWLAFYYLSLREHSKSELRAKLLAKGCKPSAVDELLVEFEQKGYQSDLRAALMVVREALRTGRGKRHIEQKLWQYGLDLPYSVNELTEMAGESLSDGTILENEEEVDWLKLAVEARCKKYGNTIPKDAKEKARQLRFLQYRGFEMGVCFDALKKTLVDFD